MSTCDVPYHATLPFVQSVVADLRPGNWLHVARFLSGLLERAPLAKAPGWDAERLVLGCLAHELRQMAQEAGEPVDGPDIEFGRDPVAEARLAAWVRSSYEERWR